jgi:hypothetical protein
VSRRALYVLCGVALLPACGFFLALALDGLPFGWPASVLASVALGLGLRRPAREIIVVSFLSGVVAVLAFVVLINLVFAGVFE